MTPQLGRALVSLILTPCVALTAIVAPEHLHEADADHPRQAIHRHVQPHAPDAHDDGHAQLADDDDHVDWLGQVATGQGGFGEMTPALASSEGAEIAPPVPESVAPPDVLVAPAHGPPRASIGPRAPPPPFA